MKIKAVCFDIDGTLYPNWQMYYAMLPTFLRNFKLNLAYSKARKEVRRIDWSDKPNLTFRQAQAQLVKDYLKSDLSEEEIEQLIEKQLYRSWESDFNRVHVYPDVREAMDLLREQGVKLGLLSDFPIQNKLRYLNLPSDYFTAMLSAEEIGRLKPDKKPFLVLAEEMGCEPSEILYVGNSYSKDIIGANRVGMFTAHLVRKKPKDTIANFSFKNFEEFIKKIKTLMI